MTDAFIYGRDPDTVRPLRRRAGRRTPLVDLAATALKGVLAKAPALDHAAIDDVAWGNANGAGEDNRNVGRMAVLLAGLPVGVPANTVNRLCGSSLDALMLASRQVETGDASVVVAGGVESMTRAPWVLPKPSRAFPAGNVEAVSTTLGWRLVNANMPEEWTVSLGESNEQVADETGIGRDRQDAFAARSHQLAAKAWDDGFYDDLVVGVEGVDLERDEGIRADSTPETLAKLNPAFRKDGSITPGNASPLNDGASALLVGSGGAAEAIGLSPIAPGRGPRHARQPAAALRGRAGRGGQQGAGPGPGSAGPTSRPSSSTRPSPCSPSPASTCGSRTGWSTPRSSTPAAVRSPSGTRSAPRVPASSAPWPTA